MNLDDALQAAAVAVLETNRPASLPAEVTIRPERSTDTKERPLLYFLTENAKRPHPKLHQIELVLVAEVRRTAESEGAADSNKASGWHSDAARKFESAVGLFADELRANGYGLRQVKKEATTSEPDGESGWKFFARWRLWLMEE